MSGVQLEEDPERRHDKSLQIFNAVPPDASSSELRNTSGHCAHYRRFVIRDSNFNRMLTRLIENDVLQRTQLVLKPEPMSDPNDPLVAVSF